MTYLKMSKQMRRERWQNTIVILIAGLVNIAFWALCFWAFWKLDWS